MNKPGNNHNHNHNKLFISSKYMQYIHNDESNNFKLINPEFYTNMDFETYCVINELYQHDGLNIFYYKKCIHEQLFYDENNSFIIKRKHFFDQTQKFNAGVFKLKRVLELKYKKSKNEKNLFGDNFQKKHIELIEHGSKYKFDFFEMYNIINSSFKQISEDVPFITNVKNPYTNQKFSYCNIVNIYFLLMNNGRIPKYFYLYFQNNMLKVEIYNQYHLNLFIDTMKYLFLKFEPEKKVEYIDRMLNYNKHYSLVRKTGAFKLRHLSGIALRFFIAIKVFNNYGDQYYPVYSRYISESTARLNWFRRNNSFSQNYSIRLG